MIKRCFDVFFSFLGLILLAPFFLLIAFLIKIDSKGPVFYIQSRVGKNNVDFKIYKFRTMVVNNGKKKLLTIGNKDARITKIGYFLRRYKLDETPQLFNVIKGDMSFVGPRPELRYFVNFYSKWDKLVLNVKPGITSTASIKYRNEAELLKQAKNPEEYFVNVIMPQKLKLEHDYMKKQNLFLDIKIIGLTLLKIITR